MSDSLKPSNNALTPKALAAKEQMGSGDEFVVEQILEHRDSKDVRGKWVREYFIRWQGFDSSHDTWEPEKNLSQDLVQNYPGNKERQEAAAAKKAAAAAKKAAAQAKRATKQASQPSRELSRRQATAKTTPKQPGGRVPSKKAPAPKTKVQGKTAAAPAKRTAAPKASGGVKKAAGKGTKGKFGRPVGRPKKAKAAGSPGGHFFVDRILAHRDDASGKQMYKIRWTGFDSSEDTWEPAGNLTPALISSYLANAKKDAASSGKAKKVTSTKKTGKLAVKVVKTKTTEPARKLKQTARITTQSKPDRVQKKGSSRGVSKVTPKLAKLQKATKATPKPLAGNRFEVESIVGHRVTQNKSEYLIRWKGFSSADDTWEPEKNLTRDLIKSYSGPRKNQAAAGNGGSSVPAGEKA